MAWIGLNDVPAIFANVFVVEVVDEDVVFNAGHVSVPLLPETMTEEERREIITGLEFLPAKPVARIALNGKRLLDLKLAAERGLAILEGQHDRRRSE